MKIEIEGVPEGKTHVEVLCFDLVYFTKPAQFIILSAGVFFFYLLYGYYQELIFSLPGFTGYGWYLTLIQFGYYSIFGKVRTDSNTLCQSFIFILSDRNVAETGGEESSPEDLHTSGHHHCCHHGIFQCQSGISQLPNTGQFWGCLKR